MTAKARRYAAFSLLRRRPQERRSLTATRDRPDVSHRGGNLRPAEVFTFASARGYAAISLLRRRPQERCSLTATRDRPDVSHSGGNLSQPEPSGSRIPDGMLRFLCSGDVPKRDAASPPPGTGQTSPIVGET